MAVLGLFSLSRVGVAIPRIEHGIGNIVNFLFNNPEACD